MTGSPARMGGEYARKRKRVELAVDSHTILGQFSQYHQAEYDHQGECSKVYVTAQHSSASDQGVLGACQQLTVNAHIGSVQPAQTARSSLLYTTTELSKASCEHGHPGIFNVEQVCFGMVRYFNGCGWLSLVPMFVPAPLNASSLV